MEGDKSKSEEDNPVSPKNPAIITETVEELQQFIKQILEEIEQDKNFSEMTAEVYEHKKDYLTKNLIELSQMHKVLVDLLLLEGSCNLEEHVVNLNKKLQSLTDEDTKLGQIDSETRSQLDSAYEIIITQNAHRTKSKENIDQLQHQVNVYIYGVAESNNKIEKMGEQLEISKKKNSIAKSVISKLKKERSENSQENQNLRDQIQSHESEISRSRIRFSSELETARELQEKTDADVSVLTSTHEAKEDSWNAEIGRLNMELKEKGDLIEVLSEKFDNLTLLKDEVDAQLYTLEFEKSIKDNIIQELQTRVDSFQDDNAGVLSSFDNVKKLTNELKMKVEELEMEVNKQR